jgi:ribosomal protein S27E
VTGPTANQEEHVAASLPEANSRWRCAGCGNLTRFDVARSRRTREFWHFDLAGAHRVEDTEVVSEAIEEVTCRWCGRADAIELVSRAEADARTS